MVYPLLRAGLPHTEGVQMRADSTTQAVLFPTQAGSPRRSGRCNRHAFHNRLASSVSGEPSRVALTVHRHADDSSAGADAACGTPGHALHQSQRGMAGDVLEVGVGREQQTIVPKADRRDQAIDRAGLSASPRAEIPHPGGFHVIVSRRFDHGKRRECPLDPVELRPGAHTLKEFLQDQTDEDNGRAVLEKSGQLVARWRR